MSEGVIKSAVIDPTGMYRYSLSRKWSDGDMVAWVMLNPSTADASVDDPTIRRCISFSKSWGYGGLTVVNLYAYRATNPDALKTAIDPIGPEHGVHFMRALHASSLIIAAWGACRHAKTDHVRPWLAQRDIQCLGVTADGSPRHPLYVKADVHLREWKLVRTVPHGRGGLDATTPALTIKEARHIALDVLYKAEQERIEASKGGNGE